jgi:ferredoxin
MAAPDSLTGADAEGGAVRHQVFIENCASTYPCAPSQTVLRGMENLGRRNIPVGCREGGCGVCKVEILEGRWRARKMSRDHVSQQDEAEGRVLACCIWPESDLRLRVLGKMVPPCR